MATEIERKFLVVGAAWRAQVKGSHAIAQGYLAGPPEARCSVRVRMQNDVAFLNIKSATAGIERDEYDYEIATADARRMLATLAGAVIEKRRHLIDVDGHLFEIDEFLGDNRGLVIVEIELTRTDATFPRPPWLGREVSALARYYNHDLARRPYAQWTEEERNAPDAT